MRADTALGSRALHGVLLLALLGFRPVPAVSGMSVAIVPPYIEKQARKGAVIKDSISFTNQGDEPVRVSVDFADFHVGEDGLVREMPPGSDASSLVRNIRISPLEIHVAPEERVFFRYSLEAPEDFRQLRSMLYFSSFPVAEPGANQVQVVARMGIPFYLENIRSSPPVLHVRQAACRRAPSSPVHLALGLMVDNEGERNIRPTGWIRVRSADGKFNQTFDFNQGKEPVLPGQTRRWDQTLGPVPEGELMVELRMTTTDRTSYEASFSVPAAGP